VDKKQGKLELTWVGKYDETVLEPRILVEDKSKSYGDSNTGNMLIHGDNLIALKALEQDFAGKVKCIYIDPPYNIDVANPNYEDGIPHSEWLSMMRTRLEILKDLLSDEGMIFCQINDDEAAYLKVVMDEIFGRGNYETTLFIKVRHENRILREDIRYQLVIEQVLCYRKSDKFLPPRREKTKIAADDYEYNIIVNKPPQSTERINGYQVEVFSPNSYKITKTAKGEGAFKLYQIRGSLITQSGSASEYYEKNLRVRRKVDGLGALYKVIGMGTKGDGLGYRYIFQPEKEKSKNGFYLQGKPIKETGEKGLPFPNYYDFVQEYNNVGYEGDVDFVGKKPEKFLSFLFSLVNLNKHDYVLDSFLGTGSTAATCHKLGINWIGIERGEHCYSHCKYRLDNIISGNDDTGISSEVDWQGGGGYKFYELAPSLLKQHESLPTMIVNPEYTFEMLCEAICKLEGFKYNQQGDMHGASSETRFIHISKDYINGEYLKNILKNIDNNQSVLIYGTKVQTGLRLPPNVEVKKIPKDLLKKCTFQWEVK
jgi:adenine-specific DNA-methyltransferase